MGRGSMPRQRGPSPPGALDTSGLPGQGHRVHPHAQLITTFYDAFSRRDGDAMAACYHPDVRFADPVFPDLKGDAAGCMWRMLCERAKDLDLSFTGVEADDETGSAHWVARYTFAATGRKVVNEIDASFRFGDGLIVAHTDRFSFWTWSGQALGPLGLALGWSPLLRGKVRRQADSQLRRFMERRSGS